MLEVGTASCLLPPGSAWHVLHPSGAYIDLGAVVFHNLLTHPPGRVVFCPDSGVHTREFALYFPRPRYRDSLRIWGWTWSHGGRHFICQSRSSEVLLSRRHPPVSVPSVAVTANLTGLSAAEAHSDSGFRGAPHRWGGIRAH